MRCLNFLNPTIYALVLSAFAIEANATLHSLADVHNDENRKCPSPEEVHEALKTMPKGRLEIDDCILGHRVVKIRNYKYLITGENAPELTTTMRTLNQEEIGPDKLKIPCSYMPKYKEKRKNNSYFFILVD
jgi:hypothetical protein